MKRKVMRPFVLAVLLAAQTVSLLVLPPVAASQSQKDSGTERRGKNGGSSGSDQSADLITPKKLVPDPPSGSSDTSQSSSQDSSSKPKDTGSGSTAKDTQSSRDTQNSKDTQNKNQTSQDSDWDARTRRDAPPFDRPPAKSNPPASSTPKSRGIESRDNNKSAQQPPQRDTQDRTSSRRSTADQQDTDYDQDEPTDRSGRQRPVLRRESDSRGGDGQGPPVLHRPSDQDSSSSSSGSNRNRDTQSPPRGSREQTANDDDVVRLESTLVNLPLLVSDRSGRYIPRLSKHDFLLWEDGTPQEIASFGSEEVPFKVALLLDVSPSVQGSVRDIQDAAIDFVRELRSQDEVMVVSFDHNVHYLSDFTSNRMQLESAIRSASIGSGTSVYEAVYEVVTRRLKNVDGRKALILFSDGEDTTSRRIGYDDAINVVTESDVLVYGLRYPGSDGGGGVRNWPWPGGGRGRNPYPQIPTFPFPWPWPRKRGPFTLNAFPNASSAVPQGQTWPRRRRGGGDFMADITNAGGGPVFDAQNVGDMRGLASRIAEELRHVYVISYYPTNPLSNGGYRSVRVQVKNRDDIAVRHRRGYNASTATTSARH